MKIKDFYLLKEQGKKFAAITAYDYSFAKLFFEEGIKLILVGDSLGMTIQGYNSTLPVTIDDIVYHTKVVRNSSPEIFLISDLPFMSYSTIDQSLYNSAKLMRAGANMVKLEGGGWSIKIISELVKRNIPVCAHLGVTPQMINTIGSYKVQGRDKSDAERLIATSIEAENAGASLIVLECVLSSVAQEITSKLKTSVIGIGSGNSTDGQIIVMHDLLGITEKIPKFAKNFLIQSKGNIRTAIRHFIFEVENGIFPDKNHSFN